MILAICGYDWLHRTFLWFFWISLPFWALLSVAIIAGHADGHLTAAQLFLLSLLGFYASENDEANGPATPGGNSINLNGPVAKNGSQQAASVVCVVGTWVYDSAHQGWNEIHPMKNLQASAWRSGWPWP